MLASRSNEGYLRRSPANWDNVCVYDIPFPPLRLPTSFSRGADFDTDAALRAALKQLGFEDTYHMNSVLSENGRDAELWVDAMDAKFEGKGTFEKEDWDRLLGHCQVHN